MSAYKKAYVSIDLLKFILSFLVVAIHFDPFGIEVIRYPVLMLPVPLFLVISGFLFFRNPALDRGRLLKFIVRNLKLYATYFILFLPYYAVIWWDAYFSKSILHGLKTLLLKFFFGSTFRSSWYIIALVIGMVIVYFLSKSRIKKLPLIIGAALYIICMLRTCYGNVISPDSLFNQVIDFYPDTFYQSFPIAVFWIALGKLIADNEQRFVSFSFRQKAFGISASIVLLEIEYAIISLTGLEYTSGYCMMLVPTCMMVFIITLGADLKLSNARFLRETSTVMYCAHTTIGVLLTIILEKLHVAVISFPWTLILYGTIVILCIMGTLIISKLEKLKYFKWCKFFK